MKTSLSLFVLALLALGLFGGVFLAAPVHATASASGKISTNGKIGTDGIVSTPLPTSTSDDADYATVCPGGLSGCTLPAGVGTSWGSTIFSVTYTGTVSIQITDCCYEGDYYALYYTTDPAGLTGWTLVGTTDQVMTGPELAAPTFDPYWTGTGSAYSSTTFNVPMSGTYLFAVRDVLFNTMVTLLGSSCGGGSAVVYSGCSATGISVSGGWSPAGYLINFAAGGTSGCLSGGATSWPMVTFTDGSTATVGVTGGAPAGACAQMTIEDLFTSNPITTTPSVSSPNYYDLSILTFTAGTASLCLTTSLASASTGMWYWSGTAWVSATSVTYSAGQLCGDIPVTALATASTPVVIGTSTITTGVPEFGAPAFMVAALGLLGVALLTRKLRVSPTIRQ